MLEPIPYFYDTINRNSIVVKAKKPFFDWINYVDPEFPVIDNEEATTYLIKEMDTRQKIENWLKKNYDQIFVNELNNYHTAEADWPQKRTFKIFKEWFSYDISTLIVDMLDKPIVKEED